MRPLLEIEDCVAVKDAGVVEIHIGWSIGTRAGREDDCFCLNDLIFANLKSVFIQKTGRTVDYLDIIAFVKLLSQRDLAGDD